MTEQKMKGLAMTGWCVRAMLAGAKGQTRRVIKFYPGAKPWTHILWQSVETCADGGFLFSGSIHRRKVMPPHQPGDIVYVKEALIRAQPAGGGRIIAEYEADNGWVHNNDILLDRLIATEARYGIMSWRWKLKRLPSIFMPKAAARMFCRIKSVRAERLQDIMAADALAEGVGHEVVAINASGEAPIMPAIDPINALSILWDELNAKRGYPWKGNWWVWVYKFEQCEKPGGD